MMARFTHFSKHALQRISERTKLNYFSIADILDYGGALDVGSELVFDRKHLLFYSDVDDCFFVAIQDSFTGLVVTVLPIDYHENLAWKIAGDSLLKAKDLASEYIDKKAATSENSEKIPPSIIIIKARYQSEEGHQKTVTLTKLKIAEYGADLSRILERTSLNAEVLSSFERKGVNPARLYEITIALGNDGEPLTIDWELPSQYQ